MSEIAYHRDEKLRETFRKIISDFFIYGKKVHDTFYTVDDVWVLSVERKENNDAVFHFFHKAWAWHTTLYEMEDETRSSIYGEVYSVWMLYTDKRKFNRDVKKFFETVECLKAIKA